MKKIIKNFLFTYCVFYASNIFFWFTVQKWATKKAARMLAKTEVFKEQGIGYSDIVKAAGNDADMFNPVYNLGYSITNTGMIVTSSVICISFLVFQYKKEISKLISPKL